MRVEVLSPGRATGEALALAEPLSFWGGFDAVTGCIIDHWHPARGTCLSGRILVMEAGRGSSSGSSVLAEAIRLGTAPAGIVLGRSDAILTIGALVAAALYGRRCPIVVAEDFARVPASGVLTLEADGETGEVRCGA